MAANRIKTIEWMLPMMNTTIPEGTSYTNSADTTIYIPETTSRTFLSVMLEVMAIDVATSAYTVNAWGIRLSCDGGSNWTSKVGVGMANTGENQGFIFRADMTAEFVARFSGTSDTARYGIYIDYASVSGQFTNVSAKLVITYEYDDSGLTTTVKTVRIPIESFNGRLSNTAQEVRQGSITNQIPALDTFLPEASKTYRQIFCELFTESAQSTTSTDTALYLKIDSGSETTFGVLEAGLVTSLSYRVLYDISSIDTSSAHALNARHNVASNSFFANLGGWITVTYEYVISSTTSVINSLIIPIKFNGAMVGNGAARERVSIEHLIAEASPSLVQSGFVLLCKHIYFTNTTSTAMDIKVGSQTATTYSTTGYGSTGAGMFQIVQRVDSGGYRGVGIAIARGTNTFTVELNGASNERFFHASMYLILNYTSTIDTAGEGVHAHTVHFYNYNKSDAIINTNVATNGITPKILESDYIILGVMMDVVLFNFVVGSVSVLGTHFNLDLAYVSGEFLDYGLNNALSVCGIHPVESMEFWFKANVSKLFKRWPNDPESRRMDIETNRSNVAVSGNAFCYDMSMWITYQSKTYTLSGNVTDYAGTGSGLTIDVYRDDTDEKIGSATSGTAGAYSFTWYNPSIYLKAETREDDTHVGRSNRGYAT